MVLPEHQGKGYATAALRLLVDRAREDGRWGDIHAFPGATNGASNALCRKHGFEQVETVDVDYAGRALRCNHWVLRAG
jgi:RimJ/RimL family protein N-acetyltransferase